MENLLSYLGCFSVLPSLLFTLLGLLLGWLFFRGKKVAGDLSIEGEGALRAEADGLRARINELEGNVSTRDGEISNLKSKLTAAAAGAAVAGGAAAVASSGDADDSGDDDETYALEWRNRYLAARVKYLESRLAEAPKAKKAAPKKKVTAKVSKPRKAAAAAGAATLVAGAATKKRKPKAKAAAKPKPKVLYDAPTDGKPDDLKEISGVGPKLEKMLNDTGVYYHRQIAHWKKADVKMVNDKLGAFPGRIERDEWVRQAKGLAAGSGAGKPAKKPRKSKAAAKPKAAGTRKRATKEEMKARMDGYVANVQKYDRNANRGTVENIVKYCGIALRTRDGSLVACSDERELERITRGFCARKLGMAEGSGRMDLVKATCEEMKGERFKNRVTFYYLASKRAGKLGIFN